ncbi:tubulin-like doman-containing protein [Mycolicibacterium sp. S3B2]|uniref:tubulin-like doman-containing protein n=1 Tax=Mycolicibacterium sp. S3B2 TaxID=3415120 RepID=UPI003C7D8976
MSGAHDHAHSHGACDSGSAGHGTDKIRLEALVTDGVHRIGEHEGPFSIHAVGIGQAGANIVESMVRQYGAGGAAAEGVTSFAGLAIDIGAAELAKVSAAADEVASDNVTVRTVDLPALGNAELFSGLRRYREFLKNEYPRYYWNPNYEPWLPNDLEVPAAGSHFPRAVAKGIYGVDYYTGGEVAIALDEFAEQVLASPQTPLVIVAFSLAGGTGSGIVVELARHLSNIRLGRRALVLGLGILPADADPEELKDGRAFIAINELDCMVDAEKNKGVMTVWGDLYKNPFTAGFFAVPQDAVVAASEDLDDAHAKIDNGVAQFALRDGGTHLYESIKALNWMNVPADAWHPATRGDQTDAWINLLAVGAPPGTTPIGDEIVASATPEFVEIRAFGCGGSAVEATDAALAAKIAPQVGPNTLTFDAVGEPALAAFVPRLSKLDLALFVPARESYDALGWEEKLMRHSWLLDLGVLLCEPSTRFEGVGGECLLGCACWVVVPHAAIRGESEELVLAK